MNEFGKKVYCLMGPTAVGKSEIAILMAQRFPFEIVSVDSAMVYRGMDIGTAKPSQAQLNSIPHHLINIRDPQESYSVGQFCHDFYNTINDIYIRGKLPLLVGGTMMYFNAIQRGISNLPESDAKIRQALKMELANGGIEVLHAQLRKVDPLSAFRININDSQRIQRALEVYELTGVPLSKLYAEPTADRIHHCFVNLVIFVKDEDKELFQKRIKERFVNMMKNGFIEEVKSLYLGGNVNSSMSSMKSIGYREIWRYLSGDLSYDEIMELVFRATKQLAKHQITWLKRWKNDAQWLHWEINVEQMASKCLSLIDSNN